MKKLLSMVLAFALVMALAVTGMVTAAAEANPSDDAYVYYSDASDVKKSGFAYDCEDVTLDPSKVNNYTVEFWIYIGQPKADVAPQYDFLIALIPDGHYDSAVSTNYTEKWAYRYEWKTGSLNVGWNKVTKKLSEFKVGNAPNSNPYTTAAANKFATDGKITAVTLHENSEAGTATYGSVNIGVSSLIISDGTNTFKLIDPAKDKAASDIINANTKNTREGSVGVMTFDPAQAGVGGNGGSGNTGNTGNGGNSVDAGDATPIVTIVFATLASALLAGVVYISLKKRTER